VTEEEEDESEFEGRMYGGEGGGYPHSLSRGNGNVEAEWEGGGVRKGDGCGGLEGKVQAQRRAIDKLQVW